jgi:hypothetical protein
MHERIERIPSLLPNAQRTVMRQSSCHASPIVSTAIQNKSRTSGFESMVLIHGTCTLLSNPPLAMTWRSRTLCAHA